MHGKEFILACLRSFFAIVTLVNVAIFVLGFAMDPERLFGYEVFLMPLIYGAIGILPNIVMYSKRELRIKELLVRKVIQLVLIEGLVLFAVFYGNENLGNHIPSVISIGVCIFLIYVIVNVIDWFQNYNLAKNMTKDLLEFQERVKD